MACENRGYIYNAYIEYDGFKPFDFRVGAYTPVAGIEDQTGSGDLFFLERAAVRRYRAQYRRRAQPRSRQHLCPGRQLSVVAVLYRQEDDDALDRRLVGTFDAQQALIGRAAWLAVSTMPT